MKVTWPVVANRPEQSAPGRSVPPTSAAGSPTAEPLAALSAAVLQLHRGSRDWPATTFDARAAELLQSVVPYLACLWGSVRADSPPGTALALHGLYSSGLHEHTLADCLAGNCPSGALLAHHIEPLAGRRVELRLWRSSEALAFDEAEQRSVDFLMPHLVEAQRENRLSRAMDSELPQRQRRSLALCDPQGVLQQADEQSLALLRLEWPRWTGGRLPAPLLEAVLGTASATTKLSAETTAALARSGPSASSAPTAATADPTQPAPATRDLPTPLSAPCFGRSITVRLSRCGQGVLLDVRRRTDADRLSTRQRDVARLYAQGLTGPQIAAQLGLTPSTVNNHLGVVFKKLAVKSKLQLLQVMRQDAAPALVT